MTAYTTSTQLTVTVHGEKYRAEFDGDQVCVYNKDNNQKIDFMGSMDEATELSSILKILQSEVANTKVIKQEEV